MDLDTSVKKRRKAEMNSLNQCILYYPEGNLKQLDQDEIIEISDQPKAPEWHEAMVNASIDIFEMYHENLFIL
jgi:hypothetical protein